MAVLEVVVADTLERPRSYKGHRRMRLAVVNMPACRGSRGAAVVRRILLEKVAGAEKSSSKFRQPRGREETGFEGKDRAERGE